MDRANDLLKLSQAAKPNVNFRTYNQLTIRYTAGSAARLSTSHMVDISVKKSLIVNKIRGV
jgi:hypothetical protein